MVAHRNRSLLDYSFEPCHLGVKKRSIVLRGINRVRMKSKIDRFPVEHRANRRPGMSRLWMEEVRDWRLSEQGQLFHILLQVRLIIIAGKHDCARCAAGEDLL